MRAQPTLVEAYPVRVPTFKTLKVYCTGVQFTGAMTHKPLNSLITTQQC